MSFSSSSIPNIGSYTVNGLRFGFAGEDVIQAEQRRFTLSPGDNFAIANTADDNGLYLINGGQQLELYNVVNDGSYSDLAGYGTGMYIDIFDNGTGDEIYMEWESGNRLLWQFIGDAIWHIDGIEQDDASPQILALDSNGDVRYIDTASFIPPAPIIDRLASAFVSPDGMGGGGAGILNITGLTIALESGTRYEIVAEFYMEENGSGPVEQFQLLFDVAPVNGYLSYELVAQTPTAVTDPLSLAKGVGTLATTITDIADFGATHLATGLYVMRIQGTIVTDSSATNIQAKAGKFGSTGAFIVNKESFIKATKIS